METMMVLMMRDFSPCGKLSSFMLPGESPSGREPLILFLLRWREASSTAHLRAATHLKEKLEPLINRSPLAPPGSWSPTEHCYQWSFISTEEQIFFLTISFLLFVTSGASVRIFWSCICVSIFCVPVAPLLDTWYPCYPLTRLTPSFLFLLNLTLYPLLSVSL